MWISLFTISLAAAVCLCRGGDAVGETGARLGRVSVLVGSCPALVAGMHVFRRAQKAAGQTATSAIDVHDARHD
jgi:hypothetical protein